MRPSVRSLAGLPLAALLAIACGSSQPPAPATSAPSGPAPAASTPAPAPTATPVPPTPTPKPLDLTSIIKTSASTGYKVSYNMRVTTEGQPPFTATTAMYVKPPKTRMDTVVKIEGKDMPASVYLLEDAMYMCGDVGGSKNCLKMPRSAEQSQTDPAFGIHQNLKDKPDDYLIESKGTRQLAGTTAHCFTVKRKTNPGTEQNEMCYSADGVPLAVYTKDKGTETVMEATSYSKSVADDDFKLPAPAMEFPGMPGMPGGTGGSSLSARSC